MFIKSRAILDKMYQDFKLCTKICDIFTQSVCFILCLFNTITNISYKPFFITYLVISIISLLILITTIICQIRKVSKYKVLKILSILIRFVIIGSSIYEISSIKFDVAKLLITCFASFGLLLQVTLEIATIIFDYYKDLLVCAFNEDIKPVTSLYNKANSFLNSPTASIFGMFKSTSSDEAEFEEVNPTLSKVNKIVSSYKAKR